MPFIEVDPIQEAIELQEMFNDDPEIKEKFRQYELQHIEAARLHKLEFRSKLIPQIK